MRSEYAAHLALSPKPHTWQVGSTFHKPAPVRARPGMLARIVSFFRNF